jgi:hypothetical protein
MINAHLGGTGGAVTTPVELGPRLWRPDVMRGGFPPGGGRELCSIGLTPIFGGRRAWG